MARSRHATVRSLERYARPGVEGEYHQLIIKQPWNDPHDQIPVTPGRD
ncbi:hypothetical protein OG851_42605 (plasmid) [Streptomyces sp. NBC_00161]